MLPLRSHRTLAGQRLSSPVVAFFGRFAVFFDRIPDDRSGCLTGHVAVLTQPVPLFVRQVDVRAFHVRILAYRAHRVKPRPWLPPRVG